jgi:hypothetical protein
MSTYNNTLRDLISFLKNNDNGGSYSIILPNVISFDTDGISGVVIGNLFSINQNALPNAYKGLDYVVRKIKHNVRNNLWTTTFEAYPFKSNNNANNISDKKLKVSEAYSNSGLLIYYENGNISLKVSTNGFNNSVVKTAVNYLQSKGYNNYAVAALVGGFLQESGLQPTASSTYNNIYQYGIAQWTQTRLSSLQSKPNYDTLQTQLSFVDQELNSTNISAGNILKSSTNLNEALVGSQQYELYAIAGNRNAYAADILRRINSGEFN